MRDITPRKIAFIGSSRDDIRVFPDSVKLDIGYALFEVQRGKMPAHMKSGSDQASVEDRGRGGS